MPNHLSSVWLEIISSAERCLKDSNKIPLSINNRKKTIPPSFFFNLFKKFSKTGLSNDLINRVNNIDIKWKEIYSKFNITYCENEISVVESSDLLISLSNPMDIYKFSEAIEPKQGKLPLEVMPNISNKLAKTISENRNSLILAENAMKSLSSINGDSNIFLSKSILGISSESSVIENQFKNFPIGKIFLGSHDDNEDDNENLGLSKDNILLLSDTSSNII